MTSGFPVSRATGPLTRMFPFCLSYLSHDFYDMHMSHGGLPRLSLCHAYISPLMLTSGCYLLPLCRRRFPLRPLVSRTTRLFTLAGSHYTQSSTRFVSLLSLTRLDDISVSYVYGSYASLYLYLSDLYIYWVGDGTIPIFNLLCNHPSVVT